MIEAPAFPARNRAWAAPAAACAVAVAGLSAWLIATPIPVLRGELRVAQFWSLELCVFLGLAVAAAVVGEIVRALGTRDVVLAAALGAVAVCLTLTLPPRMHRIFYDEQIYQNVARNLADSKLAQLCNDGAIVGGRLRCAAAEYNKQPYAYPHVLSLAYRTFGVRDALPFHLNAAAAGVAVCLTYLVVLLLFEDRVAAVFSAIVLALIPEQLIWSASAAAEPTAAAASIAALVAAACFVRFRSDTALAGSAIAAAYAIQFRPESVLIVPVVAFLVWQRAPEEFRRPRILWAALLFTALAAVHVGHLAAVRGEGWGTTHERMSLAYAFQNIRVNGWFFLRDARFPAAFTALAALGWAAPSARAGRSTCVLYFALFFAVTLSFYAGSYDYGADVRYSLATYPPLSVLAGLGAAQVVRWIQPRVGVAAACVLFAALALGQFGWVYLPVVRSKSDTAWAARADVDFARSVASKLPPNAYVLTHNPGMFQVWGVNAGQMSMFDTAAKLDTLGARFEGGVYLHWNYWCNTEDRAYRALCAKVRGLGPATPVAESRVGDQFFSFYRMGVARIP